DVAVRAHREDRDIETVARRQGCRGQIKEVLDIAASDLDGLSAHERRPELRPSDVRRRGTAVDPERRREDGKQELEGPNALTPERVPRPELKVVKRADRREHQIEPETIVADREWNLACRRER